MKILYLNPSGQLGGAERVLLDILASLRAANPSWSLYLITSEDGPLVERAAALNVKTEVLQLPSSLASIGDAGAGGPAGEHLSRATIIRQLLQAVPATLSYARKLRGIIKSLKPDVIHTNGFKMHLLGVWARPRRTPLIWHIHDYINARPMMSRALRHYSSQCQIAIANSKSVADGIGKVCGNALSVKTIYNGIDLENFAPTGPVLDLDSLSGLPPATPGTVRVGMLATLARWKGHEIFLQAMAKLNADAPIRGYIIGGALYQTNGSQRSLAELSGMVDELGLKNRIGFTGFVDSPAAAMRALDIIVHASTQPEPFGLVIAEGMACGRAVIASEAGGATEVFETEINALSHPPGDAVRLAEHIKWLATDSDLRAHLGAAARAAAEQRFNRARLARELGPIYREVVSSKS